MGLSVSLRAQRIAFDRLMAVLAERGMKASVAMIDRALVVPGTPVPDSWQDVRLRTPAGLVTLVRDIAGIQVLVMGNADAATLAARDLVAACAEEVGSR